MQVVVPVVFLVDVEPKGDASLDRMEEFARDAVTEAVQQAARCVPGSRDQKAFPGDSVCEAVGAAVSVAPAAVFPQWYRARRKRA